MIICSVLYVAELDGGIILFNKNATLKQISILLLCLKSLPWD